MLKKFGTWTPGTDTSLIQMLEICLDGLRRYGEEIPHDKFGMQTFTVAYVQRPDHIETDCFGENPEMKEGFTSIKITWDDKNEGQAEPCGEEHESVQQAPDSQKQEAG